MFISKAKCFSRQCFSIRNFAYNTHETYFFIITSNFFGNIAALYYNM